MDISRILHLAGLTESYSDDPAQSQEIERRLTTLQVDSEMRTAVLDALDIVVNSAGISTNEWAASLRKMHPRLATGDAVKEALSLAAKTYKDMIAKDKADQLWKPRKSEHEMMMTSRIELTHKAVQLVRQMNDFTPRQLVEELVSQTHNPRPYMEQFVEMFLEHFGKMLTTNPNGTLSLKRDDVTRDGTMQSFRNIVASVDDDANPYV
jgi:hypothetical protein